MCLQRCLVFPLLYKVNKAGISNVLGKRILETYLADAIRIIVRQVAIGEAADPIGLVAIPLLMYSTGVWLLGIRL